MTFRSFQSLNWAMLTGFSIIFNGLTSWWHRSHLTLHQQMSLSQTVEVPLKQVWPFLCWGHKSLQHLGDDITALCFYFCMCQTDIRREGSELFILYPSAPCFYTWPRAVLRLINSSVAGWPQTHSRHVIHGALKNKHKVQKLYWTSVQMLFMFYSHIDKFYSYIAL